ncbi:MAG: thiol reductant ABC exporter subunit CydC [Anaerolineaceae bacterium]|nr:thiol reductant ABC exporter subunit CydC [Anaerolineaceae bacterium]
MIKFFLNSAKEYRYKVGFSILLSCLTILSAVGLMGVSAYLIILAGFHPSIAILQTSIVGVRFFGISRGIFRYLERLTTHQVNFQILGKIRLQVFKNISSRFIPIIDRYSGSEILSIIINDINMMENLYVKLMSPLFVAFFISALIGVFFGMYAIEIFFIYLFGFLLVGIAIPFLSFKLSKLSGGKLESSRMEYQSAVIDFYQFMHEAIFFQVESRLISNLRESEKKLDQTQKENGIWQSVWNMLSLFSVQGIFLTTLVISGGMVQSGRLEAMMIGVISLMLLTSFEAISSLPSASYLYSDINSSSKRILEISTIPETNNPLIGTYTGEITPIQFLNVAFAYLTNKEHAALKEINLEIKKGEKVAFVGMNGAGKTTLMEILLGYRKEYTGQIFLNNHELKEIRDDVLRTKINYLSAKPYFFSTTIRQNLLLARKNFEDQTLINALKKLSLYDHKNLNLDTQLDEFGKNLSSGELQKLAIAQLLLLDGEVIILDEPFANMDPISANEINKEIRILFDNKTLLFITHNLKNMEYFNKIVVMDQGRILQTGDHKSLFNQTGKYKDLFNPS